MVGRARHAARRPTARRGARSTCRENHGVAADAARTRLGRSLVAAGVRGPGAVGRLRVDLQRGDGFVRGDDRALDGRARHGRPDADGARHRDPAAPSRGHPARRRVVVPALLRAGRRKRSRHAGNEGGARRRHLGRQRTEGLDIPRPVRALRHPARPHRPRRPEARRTDVLHRRHAGSGHRDPAARADDRARPLQRNVPRRGADPPRERRRRRR